MSRNKREFKSMTPLEKLGLAFRGATLDPELLKAVETWRTLIRVEASMPDNVRRVMNRLPTENIKEALLARFAANDAKWFRELADCIEGTKRHFDHLRAFLVMTAFPMGEPAPLRTAREWQRLIVEQGYREPNLRYVHELCDELDIARLPGKGGRPKTRSRKK